MITGESIKIEIHEEVKKFLRTHYNLIVFDHDYKSLMCFGEFYFYQKRNGDTYIAPPFQSLVKSTMQYFKDNDLYDEHWKKFCSFLDKQEEAAVTNFKNQDK